MQGVRIGLPVVLVAIFHSTMFLQCGDIWNKLMVFKY